jgi:alkylated DNA repair dioxygenase AlkB
MCVAGEEHADVNPSAGTVIADPRSMRASTVEKAMQQEQLFPATQPLPRGLNYREAFISPQEEQELLAVMEALPLAEAKYKQYTARRRTLHYGFGYDFDINEATPAPPLPDYLERLRMRAAHWVGVEPQAFVQALLAEYRPGTPLGWHRDVPEFEIIVGISLAGSARMRFRPYPWRPERKKEIFALELKPRSAYVLRDAARWGWQHSIPPTKMLRYSVSFWSRRE